MRSWLPVALGAALLLGGCGARLEPAAGAQVPAPTPQAQGPLAGRVIVLDPGHGSHTGEHSAAGNWEDDNVFAIAQDAAPLLTALGASVHLTRTTPEILGDLATTDLSTRVAEATAWHADVFVSIHQNYVNGAPDITGVETFWSNADSQALATDLQAALVADTGLLDRHTDSAPYWVIACNPMPAALIEGGFLSNADEAGEISAPGFQEREAQAITSGLEKYLSTPGAVVGAQPLTGQNKYMCATMDPAQANAWLRQQGS